MSEPRYTRPALQDLVEIAKYIGRDNPVAAARMADRIEAACKRLMNHPERGGKHDDLPEPLLVFAVGIYLVVYRVDDEGPLILRVIHGARDLATLFPDY